APAGRGDSGVNVSVLSPRAGSPGGAKRLTIAAATTASAPVRSPRRAVMPLSGKEVRDDLPADVLLLPGLRRRAHRARRAGGHRRLREAPPARPARRLSSPAERHLDARRGGL